MKLFLTTPVTTNLEELTPLHYRTNSIPFSDGGPDEKHTVSILLCGIRALGAVAGEFLSVMGWDVGK